MALLSALLGRETRASVESPAVPLTASTLVDLFAQRSSAGPYVSEQTAHRVIAVYRAWALLGGTVGSLPIKAYAGEPPGGDRWTGPEANLLAFPGGRDETTGVPVPGAATAVKFYETLMVHLLSWGNAYALKRWNAGRTRVLDLDLLLPSHVAPLWVDRTAGNPSGKAFDVHGADNGRVTRVYPRDVIHVPGLGSNLLMGISPIGAARQALGMAVAAEEYGARLFANGSLAGGVLEAPMMLDETQSNGLKRRWRERAEGLANAHEAVVLDAGVKFHQLTMPPQDTQFVESRKFQVVEIARLYGIPPHLLGDVERSTSWGTGIAEQGIAFVTYTLRPWLAKIEQALSNELLPRGINARFDVSSLLRGDPKGEVEAHAQAIESGQETPNEARAARGLPPVPGGDQLMFPMNYGSLMNVANPPVQAPPRPAPNPTPTGGAA